MALSGGIDITQDRVLANEERITNAEINEAVTFTARLKENSVTSRELADEFTVKYFDTVADLQANSEAISNNTRVLCTGWYTQGANDFGPELTVDTSDTTTAEDELSCFHDANGLRYKRTLSGFVNVRWGGLKPNDNTFDNRAKLQTMVTYCCDNACILEGNPETYYVEETGASSTTRASVTYKDYVTYKSNFRLHGNGMTLRTQYAPATSATQGVMLVRDETETTVTNVNVQDVNFRATGGAYYVTGLMFNGTDSGAEGNFTFPSASGLRFTDVRGGINIFGYGTGGGAGGEDTYQVHHVTLDNLTSTGTGAFVVNCNSGRNVSINGVNAEKLSADVLTISGVNGCSISNVSAVAGRDTNDYGDSSYKSFDGINVVCNNNGKHIYNVTLSNVNIWGGPVSFRTTDNGGGNAYTYAQLEMHNISLSGVLADRIQFDSQGGATSPFHDMRQISLASCVARNNNTDASDQGAGGHEEPSKRGYYFYYAQDVTMSACYAYAHTWQGAYFKNCLDVQVNGIEVDKTDLTNLNNSDHNEGGVVFEDTNRIQANGVRVFKTIGVGLALIDCDQVTGTGLYLDCSGPATGGQDSTYANDCLHVEDCDDVLLTDGRLNDGERGLYVYANAENCADCYFDNLKWRDQSSKYIDYTETGGTITKWNVRNPDYAGLTYSSTTVNFKNSATNTAMGIDLQRGAGTDLTIADQHTAWVTSTAYVIGNQVENSGINYICLVDHTSGTFSTDLAAGKWTQEGIQIEREFHQIEEAADTTDVVTYILHGVKGQIVAFQIASSNAITFQHAGGSNIRTNSGANVTLSNSFTVIRFFFDGSNWIEIA